MVQLAQHDRPAEAVGEALPDIICGDASASQVDLSLPEVGRAERAGLFAARTGFLLWSLYLAALYFIPSVWTVSVAAADALLWPVIRLLGPVGGVIAISLLTAFLTMACQWLCTDVTRLREVRRRLLVMVDLFKKTARESAEEEALERIIRSGEWRVARAAFVPLGLLFGPVLLSFMWFPVRVDPQFANPAPGAPVRLLASLDGEYSGPLSVRLAGAQFADGTLAATSTVASLRQTLDELRRQLLQAEQGLPVTSAVRDHLASTGKSLPDARAELDAALARPLPSQVLQWSLQSAPAADLLRAELLLPANAGSASIDLPLGNARPVPLGLATDKNEHLLLRNGTGPLHKISLRYTDHRPADQRALWRPFAPLGSSWDAGWLSLYLLAYIPAMFLFKRLFRLP